MNQKHMTQNPKQRRNLKRILFFSTTLTPQKSALTPVFDNQIDNDPVYLMAQEVKRKLIKTIKRPIRLIGNKNQSCFIKNQEKSQILIKNQDNNISHHHHHTTLYPRSQKKSLNNYIKKTNPFSPKTLDQQMKLLSKVTIHRIRSQRQKVQTQTRKIQTQYKYLLSKIQKNKKKSQEMKQKKKKLQNLKSQNKFLKQQTDHERQIIFEQKQMEISRLRQSVLHQKASKRQTLNKFFSNRLITAEQIREQTQFIQQQKLKNQLSLLQKKKQQYIKQKQNEKKRLLKREQNLQSRKLMARSEFKQRWLDEYGKSSKARLGYVTKKQLLSRKMQTLLQQLRNQEENQINLITDNHHHQHHEKVKINIHSNINPQQAYLKYQY